MPHGLWFVRAKETVIKRAVKITRRPALEEDIHFARTVHHLAYRDVVTRQFGSWDETLQNGFFRQIWLEGEFEIILCDQTPCGYVSVERHEDYLYVRELVILPEYQGQGIGTYVLNEILADAKARSLSVEIQALHRNHAINLYQRLGFRKYGKTVTHTLLQWTCD